MASPVEAVQCYGRKVRIGNAPKCRRQLSTTSRDLAGLEEGWNILRYFGRKRNHLWNYSTRAERRDGAERELWGGMKPGHQLVSQLVHLGFVGLLWTKPAIEPLELFGKTGMNSRGTGPGRYYVAPLLENLVRSSPDLSSSLFTQKTATAVAHVKRGKGLIKLNGSPIDLIEPEILKYKVLEPMLIVGKDKFAGVDIRIRVQGGGHVSQIYGGLLDVPFIVDFLGLLTLLSLLQPSGKRLPRASLLSTRNTLTRRRRRRFRTSSSLTTGACSSQTPAEWSRKSSAVLVPVPDTKRWV